MKKPFALALILMMGSMTHAIAQEDGETIRTVSEGGFVPDEPLWEVRLGGTSLYGPDYPGSPDNSLNGFAAPLVIYRGDRIRFGEYGVARAITAETRTFELDISVDAVYEAGSNEDGARAGMPDLDYLLQIGPQAIVNFHDTGWTPDGRSEVKMLLPVRAVASTDFTGFEHVGYIAEPQLTYRRQYGGARRSSWSLTLFSTFADEGLNGFWYNVAPQFATPERSAYSAQAGYLSSGLKASWTRELSEDFQLYLTYQGRAFQGSANEDSPLLTEDFTHAFSISFVWKLFKSKRRARNDDM
ncbi:MipA/OmpV family protein [Henriciella sp.]|uniref:MipA/OmpV family protein n=1 Tax=Henriciella sp. TaxID=1968823 RepID=UPI0026228C69|nr:MipA/OmpV family protein [Henriciella sp.]